MKAKKHSEEQIIGALVAPPPVPGAASALSLPSSAPGNRAPLPWQAITPGGARLARLANRATGRRWRRSAAP
jgi:hypothetical protein